MALEAKQNGVQKASKPLKEEKIGADGLNRVQTER